MKIKKEEKSVCLSVKVKHATKKPLEETRRRGEGKMERQEGGAEE